jgi:hypothetical protein
MFSQPTMTGDCDPITRLPTTTPSIDSPRLLAISDTIRFAVLRPAAHPAKALALPRTHPASTNAANDVP